MDYIFCGRMKNWDGWEELKKLRYPSPIKVFDEGSVYAFGDIGIIYLSVKRMGIWPHWITAVLIGRENPNHISKYPHDVIYHLRRNGVTIESFYDDGRIERKHEGQLISSRISPPVYPYRHRWEEIARRAKRLNEEGREFFSNVPYEIDRALYEELVHYLLATGKLEVKVIE